MTVFTSEAVLEPPVSAVASATSDGYPLSFGGIYNGGVAVSGVRVAVGAWGAASGVGMAFVYVLASAATSVSTSASNSTASADWLLEQSFSPTDPTDSAKASFFGLCVALQTDRLAIGAPGGGELSYAGAVYLYQRSADSSGDAWVLSQRLTEVEPSSGNVFGWHAAMRGETLAVGAYGHSSSTGRVYMYALSADRSANRSADRSAGLSAEQSSSAAGSGTVEVEATLEAQDAAQGSNFGWSLSLSPDGNLLVVGAARADSVRGAAYVFKRSVVTSSATSPATSPYLYALTFQCLAGRSS